MRKKVVIDKSFQNWTRRDLQRYLGVNHQKNFKPLQDWFAIDVDLTNHMLFKILLTILLSLFLK